MSTDTTQEEGIPYEFTKYGDLFQLQVSNGKVAMYQRTRNGKPRGFEVVLIQTRPDGEINGKPIKGGECLPSASQWGVMGWSYLATEEEKAKARFARACNPESANREAKRVATLKERAKKALPERRIERRIKR